ncbi:MAG TPA: ABC transporter substrate-binding protein [Methylomusa anaerophila]|nr:ABC transporter substrate-binding protein [Methylomusa anaerophila]HML89607.1 ABC transporter substrate-binding protein [Methylomusa anaerophila]
MYHRLFSRNIVLLALVLATAFAVAGCGQKDEKAAKSATPGVVEITELRYQGWTGQVTLAELAEDLGYLAPIKLKWVGNTISGPQDIQATATGDIDFGSAFTGSVIGLKAANAPVKAVISSNGVNEKSHGSLVVLQDSPIKEARDLIGKKIAVNTLGAHHEVMIKSYLRKAGLTEDEIRKVELVVTPPANTEQALRQGQVEASFMTGFWRDKAMERGSVRSVVTDYQLFGNFNSSCLVMSEKFIKENPNTVKKFVEGLAKAIEWANTTPRDEVVDRMENIINKRKRNENTEGVKYWRHTGIASKGGVISEGDLKIWIDWLVQEGKLKEGQVKVSSVYTNDFNPFRDR